MKKASEEMQEVWHLNEFIIIAFLMRTERSRLSLV